MYRNYQDPAYKTWRINIYKRDGFCCKWPGCPNKKKLRAHHILKWADYPFLRFNISNGITLCKQHHDNIEGDEDGFIRFFMELLK